MNLSLSASFFCLALATPVAALACQHATAVKSAAACTGHATTASTCDGIKKISVGQLAALKRSEHPVNIFDANRATTRQKHGIVPGATLLSSYKDYDIQKELPKDRNALLVFYCANEKCSAAPAAAERAQGAGFTNVYVMHAGIMGWAQEGQAVIKPSV